ncbi:MAG TPA: SDR family oxidoreductase [Kiritimatiellia bacterium]|nr:SDR family oxidoreductase [Kiritimatiellia bacterium]
MNRRRFDISGKVAVLTGAGGILIREMARALGSAGVKVALLNRTGAKAEALAREIMDAGGVALPIEANVLDRHQLQQAHATIHKALGPVDILINGAGGNLPAATTSTTQTFFDLPAEAMRQVFDLNLMGSILPIQVFGRDFAESKSGVIVNISSASAIRPLTKVATYGSAKAAIENLTKWLAVHMAREYGPDIRVNALCPGFIETAQNRFLLRDAATGDLSARGHDIIAHTPAGRFGAAEDLIGTLLWLVSPASAFVTGTVVVVDGGFSAFSGV